MRPIHWTEAYRMRWKRRRLLWRSFRSRHNLTQRVGRTGQIGPQDIVAVSTMRNEITRLPHFLGHYRAMGVDHFLVVDNDSDDGTTELLADQPDVSLWTTGHSYRAARFGLDWMTWLQMRHARGHWCLMVDADELLVYAHHDTRNLRDLTAWLDGQALTVFGAHLLDLYPKGPLDQHNHEAGDDPLDLLQWFDPPHCRAQRQYPMGNLWVQGGVRERMFFQDAPVRSPTLNKIPLVRWNRRYAYVNACHSALPPRLNAAYDGPGGSAPSGVLLHTKFLPEVVEKSRIEKQRGQHFYAPDVFHGYYDDIAAAPDLWTDGSIRYEDWRQLEQLGFMSSGGWQG